jgi:cytidine deaminase
LKDSEAPKLWAGGERRIRPERRGTDRRRPADRRVTARRSGSDRRDAGDWETVPLELTAAANLAQEQVLLAAAAAARANAHAQYSNFRVGAALETVDGPIVGGCNIENATYGLTLCAERVALVKALSDGHAVFTRIAVVADTAAPTPPCGPCRQLLWEYCGDIDIILGNLHGPTGRFRLSTLLPLPFDRRLLR